MLFRQAIKKVSDVRNNLTISFDHGSQIILGKKGQENLRIVKNYLEKAIK